MEMLSAGRAGSGVSKKEVEDIRRVLMSTAADHETVKLCMVRLAHDGSDASVETLKAYKSRVPLVLRGFFECAWDECSYFNFIDKVGAVVVTPEDTVVDYSVSMFDLQKEIADVEEVLADRGILVDTVRDLPDAIQLAYMKRLVVATADARYLGSGFVHFDGCDGNCDGCIQSPWCYVTPMS